MTHPVFAARPWFTESSPLPDEPVGMLRRHEARLFHDLAKDVYTGRGTIVDAGSFLGKSAYYFANGLRANPAFDRTRDRVHCFDNFVVNEEGTTEFIRKALGQTLGIGESTREIFERQVAPVRDLLQVHAGDFHVVPWPSQPIEILMVDIAKSESLGKRVVEVFFPDLVPGLSIVVHQDYHHPWLPHIHVVMEYLADYFQIVAPRVDSSAGFLLTKAIPTQVLRRAIAHDFSLAEQLALMDRALERLPADDRHFVELARLKLQGKRNDSRALRDELDRIESRHAEAKEDHSWRSGLEEMRIFVDEAEGWQQKELGNFARALELADSLIARRGKNSQLLVLRATALNGLARHAEAESILREALQFSHRNGYAYVVLAGLLVHLGRIDEAEGELVRGALDRSAFGTRPVNFLEMLANVWEKRPRAEQVAAVMDRLFREIPAEPEVWVLDAKVKRFVGMRREAALSLRKARDLGLPAERLAKVLQVTGITLEERSAAAEA